MNQFWNSDSLNGHNYIVKTPFKIKEIWNI